MSKQQQEREHLYRITDRRYGRDFWAVDIPWPDGERYRVRFPNRDRAEERLDRIEAAIKCGMWKEVRNDLKPKVKAAVLTESVPAVRIFGELAAEFKTHVLGEKSGSGWPKTQCYLIGAMEEFFGADTPITDITIKRAEEFMAHRRAEDEVRPCTINKDIAVLRAMYAKAMEWKWITVNPIAGLKNYDDDTLVHDRYLRGAEFDALQKAEVSLPQSPDAKMVFEDMLEFMVVGFHTGLRFSELVTATFGHVDFSQRLIAVKNKPNKRTKNGLERRVPLNQAAYDALVKLRGKATKKAGLIFQTENGSSWLKHRSVLQRRFNACVEAAGLYSEDPTQNVTIHTLRHSFGTLLAQNNVPVHKIKLLMGHHRLETTMRYMNEKETHGYTDVLMKVSTIGNVIGNVQSGSENQCAASC